MSTIKTEMKKGEKFVAQVVAFLKGDGNEELANKIARKAISAFDGQVAALKAKEVDDENTVEDMEDALKEAIFPTKMFSDNKAYCQNIVYYQEKVNDAKAVLENTRASIKFFADLLESI